MCIFDGIRVERWREAFGTLQLRVICGMDPLTFIDFIVLPNEILQRSKLKISILTQSDAKNRRR